MQIDYNQNKEPSGIILVIIFLSDKVACVGFRVLGLGFGIFGFRVEVCSFAV